MAEEIIQVRIRRIGRHTGMRIEIAVYIIYFPNAIDRIFDLLADCFDLIYLEELMEYQEDIPGIAADDALLTKFCLQCGCDSILRSPRRSFG